MTEVLQYQIRQALLETTGCGRDASIAEVASLSGIKVPTLYQLRRGDLTDHDTLCRHLVALLAVPAFTERYMAFQGYSCAYVAEEETCAWKITAAICEASGRTAEYIADGRYDHSEKANLATKVLPPLVRKAVAFIAQQTRRSTGARA